eukprot:COSAG01_NODE_10326_length_2192_cov_8.336837_1_plen_29_part_10
MVHWLDSTHLQGLRNAPAAAHIQLRADVG